MSGDTTQPRDVIKQHKLPKTIYEGGDAGRFYSEAKEVKQFYTDDDIDKSQDEDCGVGSYQRLKSSKKRRLKDAAGLSGQSDSEQEDLDTLDRKCIKGKNKNKNNEVIQSVEVPRLRTSKKQQNKAHQGEGDVSGRDETNSTQATSDNSSNNNYTIILYGFCILLFLLVLVGCFFLIRQSPSLQKEYNFLEVFHQEMEKIKSIFPSQHRELWRRSKIHLQKHLNLSDPSEPVSLILTSGRGAEKTLGCLAQQLAAVFSNTLNSSVLDINGTSKRDQDSDQVKLDIDKELKEAFEGTKRAAVIHRFEELPPGSTLIFYRYCDHENAAFKRVFLMFTVMLQEKMDFQPNVSLPLVEEMVQMYLQEKFVSSDRTAKFNQMDLDKLSGLWSRISHLILPVSAEQRIEQHGCQIIK